MIFGLHVIASAAQEPERIHVIPFFPSASDAYRDGLARVINHSGEAGEVRIEGFDEEGEFYGAVMLSVDAGEAVHFNSEDLESGAAEKGLSGAIGPGEGAWRLQLSSERDIEVLSYFRTADGFLTAMHDTVAHEGGVHRVAFFNPGSNYARRSVLRLVNPGEEAAAVSIAGVDDRGESPGSEVTTTIPAGASRTFTAAALESGDEGLEGALDDGEGKWRLLVQSAQPLVVMSLLSDLTGHLSNLSTAPGRESQARPDLVVEPPSVSNRSPVAGQTFSLSATVRNDGGADSPVTALRYYRSSDATITATDRALGTDAVAGLSASGSASASVTVSAPSTPGRYYYGACVDAVAEESDTTDNCSASVQVDVEEPPDPVVQSVEVTPDEVTFASLGDTATLTARVLDTRGNEMSGETVSWSSRSPDVATVDAQGVVTTVANGRATMTASASGVSDTATVIVYQRADSVDIAPGEVELTSVGETALLTLRAFDANGHEAPGGGDLTSWRWRSADPNVATVSPVPVITLEAEVQAVAAGTTTVTVTAVTEDGGTLIGTATVKVTVTQTSPDLSVGSPTVDDTSPETGATFTLSATVSNDGDGAAAATTLRYYRSTDATITTSDTAAGTDDVAALSASGTSAESISLTAPSDEGTYYYGACVDAVTAESDTTNNCSASVKVDVETPQPSASRVLVYAPQSWLQVGGTVTYSAHVLDSEGEEMSGYTFSWSSSDTTKATVDSNGVVTAVAVGKATISASASATASATVKASSSARNLGTAASSPRSTLSGSYHIFVVERVDRIELSPSSLSFAEVGDWETVTATLYDTDGNEMRPTSWGWYSADEEVATVNSRGGSEVSAGVQSIGEGTTTVSLSANGTRKSMSVTVTLPTARVDISPRSLTFEALGDTRSVTVRVLDADGDEVENATFAYTAVSSACCRPDVDLTDPSVFGTKRTDDGLEITSRGPGSGRVTISSTDVEPAILPVTVYKKVATLEVSPSSTSLAVDGTATLRAALKDANGHSIHVDQGDGRGGKVVYWETSDSAVATVEGNTADEDGNTGGTATVTAVGAGTATITGRWGGNRVTGTATVTVTDSSN